MKTANKYINMAFLVFWSFFLGTYAIRFIDTPTNKLLIALADTFVMLVLAIVDQVLIIRDKEATWWTTVELVIIVAMFVLIIVGGV